MLSNQSNIVSGIVAFSSAFPVKISFTGRPSYGTFLFTQQVLNIKTISKGIPIFIGSVEQDPYTSDENVKKLK